MGVSIFGVTWQDIEALHSKANYAAISTKIEAWIGEGGAEASTIVQEAPGIDPSDVPQDEPLYKHCRAYVIAYAGRKVVQWGTNQNPALAQEYGEDMKRLEKLMRAHPVGAMGDSFDRSEHIGTFRGGKARGGGGRIVKGSHRWDSKTRM